MSEDKFLLMYGSWLGIPLTIAAIIFGIEMILHNIDLNRHAAEIDKIRRAREARESERAKG